MKRSEINKYIREFREALDAISFKVPPFCHIKAEDWRTLVTNTTRSETECWAGT